MTGCAQANMLAHKCKMCAVNTSPFKALNPCIQPTCGTAAIKAACRFTVAVTVAPAEKPFQATAQAT